MRGYLTIESPAGLESPSPSQRQRTKGMNRMYYVHMPAGDKFTLATFCERNGLPYYRLRARFCSWAPGTYSEWFYVACDYERACMELRFGLVTPDKIQRARARRSGLRRRMEIIQRAAVPMYGRNFQSRRI